MKSLGVIPPAKAVAAMQSINVLVYRSVFMVGLSAVSGARLVIVAGACFSDDIASGLLFAGGMTHLVAVMGVSAIGNIPLNNQLAGVEPDSSGAALVWRHYLTNWVNRNPVRILGATVAALLMTIATFEASRIRTGAGRTQSESRLRRF